MGRGTTEEIICNGCGAPQMRPSSAVYKTNFCNQGCRNKVPKDMKIPDIIGSSFGKLTVIKHLGIRRGNKRYFLCQCACGNQSEVEQYHLRTGKTTSCGCNKGKKFTLEAYKNRWDALVMLALDKPNLRSALDNIQKEFPADV